MRVAFVGLGLSAGFRNHNLTVSRVSHLAAFQEAYSPIAIVLAAVPALDGVGARRLREGWSVVVGEGGYSRRDIAYYSGRTFLDILRIIIAILLPPLGVFLQVGIGKHFWINILLTILGYIPGIIHAVWIIARK